jgi:hypothetical protein
MFSVFFKKPAILDLDRIILESMSIIRVLGATRFYLVKQGRH